MIKKSSVKTLMKRIDGDYGVKMCAIRLWHKNYKELVLVEPMYKGMKSISRFRRIELFVKKFNIIKSYYKTIKYSNNKLNCLDKLMAVDSVKTIGISMIKKMEEYKSGKIVTDQKVIDNYLYRDIKEYGERMESLRVVQIEMDKLMEFRGSQLSLDEIEEIINDYKNRLRQDYATAIAVHLKHTDLYDTLNILGKTYYELKEGINHEQIIEDYRISYDVLSELASV